MVITMISMHMMQATIYNVINMITMRHGRMAAIRAVYVIDRMTSAQVLWGTRIRICCAFFDYVFINVIAVREMHMAIV